MATLQTLPESTTFVTTPAERGQTSTLALRLFGVF